MALAPDLGSPRKTDGEAVHQVPRIRGLGGLGPFSGDDGSAYDGFLRLSPELVRENLQDTHGCPADVLQIFP